MKIKVILALTISFAATQVYSQQIVHTDNTIILGSQCTGIDCTTSESFGFDTHRYKESNLRIHFDDATSNSSSFPKNDWRIVINDSNNGGDNYFAIDDASAEIEVFRIEAGAPEGALYVRSNGNTGIGTNNPQSTIHLLSGSTPALRFEQDTSESLTSGIWDIRANDSSLYVTDVSNGGSVPFRIMSAAPSASFVLDSSGQIGMGTDMPMAGLHLANRNLRVEGSVTSLWDAQNPDTSLFSVVNTNSDINPGQEAAFTVLADGKMGIGTSSPDYDLQVAGDVDVTGELTAASDRRLKKDIVSLENAMDMLVQLNPVSYYFRTNEFPELHLSHRRKMGLIAQEVEAILPNLISTETKATDRLGNEWNLKSVNYIEIIPLIIQGLQDQQLEIDRLSKLIEQIKVERHEFESLKSTLIEIQEELDQLHGKSRGTRRMEASF